MINDDHFIALTSYDKNHNLRIVGSNVELYNVVYGDKIDKVHSDDYKEFHSPYLFDIDMNYSGDILHGIRYADSFDSIYLALKYLKDTFIYESDMLLSVFKMRSEDRYLCYTLRNDTSNNIYRIYTGLVSVDVNIKNYTGDNKYIFSIDSTNGVYDDAKSVGFIKMDRVTSKEYSGNLDSLYDFITNHNSQMTGILCVSCKNDISGIIPEYVNNIEEYKSLIENTDISDHIDEIRKIIGDTILAVNTYSDWKIEDTYTDFRHVRYYSIISEFIGLEHTHCLVITYNGKVVSIRDNRCVVRY